MYSSLALAAALWPANITEYCPPLGDSTIIGVAFNPRREFLYCEYFSQTSEHQISVNYMRNSTSFASKELDYSINPSIPSVKQLDRRSGEYREANIDGDVVLLHYKSAANKKTATARLSLAEVDVVDAGFDKFVKSNWDRLMAGDSLTINFGSIAHLKSLPLRVKYLPKTQCSQQAASQAQYCFSVDIDNALLSLLLSSINISYDEKKRLVQFSGVVNLQDDSQKSQSATISYFYKEDYLINTK